MTQLSDVIQIVESSNNQNALRFEPVVYQRNENLNNSIIQNIMSIHKCSQGTAVSIYCTSYGLFQIMGFNLYNVNSCNVKSNIIAYCNSIQLQQATFYNLLRSMHIDPNIYTPQALANSHQLRVQFGNTYNGNGNAYEPLLKRALSQLGLNVIN